MERTPSAAFWWGVTWLLRLGVPAALYAAWSLYAVMGWMAAAAAAAAGYGCFALQRETRHVALGWIVDSNGERQKVESWSKGHAIYTPTTRSQRIVEEATIRDERRKKLMWWGVWAALFSVASYEIWPYRETVFGPAGLLVAGTLAVGMTGSWLRELALEILYLGGWQDMKGAQVLDDEPRRPGLDEVLRQKAHGDARLATETEARAAAGDAPRRPRLHEREF